MEMTVFKRTQDDWYGSYYTSHDEMLVECIFNGNIMQNFPGKLPIWRTCVWGTDDCGMEIDCTTEAEAWIKFLQVIGLEFVNRDELLKLGFVSA